MASFRIRYKDDYRVEKGTLITSWWDSNIELPIDADIDTVLSELLKLTFKIEMHVDFDDDDISSNYDPTDEEEEWISRWANACSNLLNEYRIDTDYERVDYVGALYILQGTAGDLISFMEHYTNHFGPDGFADDGSIGVVLDQEKSEFENFLDCFAQGTQDEFEFEHINIIDLEEYTITRGFSLIDPDDNYYTRDSLKELKDYFMANYGNLSIRFLCPNGGFDYSDMTDYLEDLTGEEANIIEDWESEVRTLKGDLDLYWDWDDNDEEGTYYVIEGTPENVLRFLEEFEYPEIRTLPRHPLRIYIDELRNWITQLFPIKRLGFFGESLEDGNPTIDELEAILTDNDDEAACKILFNRNKTHVYTANAYVMLLEQFTAKDWTKDRLLDSYRRAGIEIFPSFEKYFRETDRDELRRVARELQRLNVKDYKWGILYGSGEENPLSLNKALNDCGRDYVVYFWKTVKNQMEYIEAKGWVTRQKKLGFFDK